MIYFDNAATTCVFPEVVEAMQDAMQVTYGNPSAKHMKGIEAENKVKAAQELIAKTLRAKPKEILFTSGGTESNNTAIIGTAMANRRKGKHIITTKVEHASVYEPMYHLEEEGYEVTYLDVDEYGKVDPIEFEAAIKDTTILASIMFANNEIGTVEPIKELGAIAHSKGVIFHTDAVQAFAHIPINVQEMNIDMLSASGHKFHGPKGIGFLYVSNKVKIGSFIHGGSQERSRRAGTHNVPGIIGMAKAASIANTNMSENIKNISVIRDHIIDRVLAEIPYSRVNGDRTDRLPGNVHFCFRFIEGESMLIMLDQKGICGSSGSACTSGSLDPSHVLLAIGLPHEIAHGSLRLSLGEDATIEDADYVVDELKGIVERLRSMSPLYEDFVKEQGK